MKRAEEQMFKERKSKIDWKNTFTSFSNDYPFAFGTSLLIGIIILVLLIGFIIDFLINHPIYALYLLYVGGALVVAYIIFSFIKSIKRKRV